jgi:ABC-2 type transport system ATP-binding protein
MQEVAAASASTGVLEIDNLTRTFTVRDRVITALDQVDFAIKPGRVTGLIGPDGAGKTTLMRIIAGLLVPDSGRALVFGNDATRDFISVQSMIGYMPQRFGLYEDLTVQENLDLYADLQGVPEEDRKDRYSRLMEMTGMAPFTGRLAGRLSGGMKQKLGLACTLIRPPALLLLDEPTVGVDPVSRRELWEIVYHQVEDESMTVLLSTAYLDEAQRCAEVVLMYEGRLLGQDRPDVFEEQMQGCTFTARDSGHRRDLQERLSKKPGIIDAIILGDRVRLVTREPQQADQLADRLTEGTEKPDIQPVEPRFEDAFITLLRREQERAGYRRVKVITPRALNVDAGRDVIITRDLQRRFGDFYAVRDLSFTVRQGEIFGLLGANGAGKSTTFRMLCGLLPASGGTLEVAGHDLRVARAEARGHIGYMAQKFSLYGGMSVVQNLSFFASAYGLFGKLQRQRIDWALESFELTEVRDSTSGDLPLGYKQRLAMAAALMHEPEILFLDEPTSGVDPLARRDFWHQINALARSGVTVLVTTHFMEEAEYCDRLVIMARGQVLAAGDPQELKQQAATPERPDPTMEDAFIDLIEAFDARQEGTNG